MAPIRSTGFVDPGWDHGIAQDERKKKVRCNYCGKIVSGGIYRLKQHLARVSGEVTYCEKAPDEVYLKMKENLEGSRSHKKQKQVDAQAYMNFHSNDDEDEEEQVGCRSKGKQLMDDRNVSVNLTPLRSLGYVDPGWEHGVAQDERKKKVKCNYCEKIVSGGINRFKQHLARIPGEVAPCKNAPEEVYQKIKENMKWHRTGRRLRRPETKELMPFYAKSDNDDDELEHVEDALHHMNKETLMDVDKRFSKDIMKTFKGMPPSTGPEPLLRRSRLDNVYLKLPKNQTPQTYKQIKVKTGPTKKLRKEVISSICKFFYHAGIPIQAADSIYFHKMLEMVGQYGQGLELLKPAATRFASSFATLQSLLDHRVGLRRMFLSNKWILSRFSSSNEGKEVEKIVLNVTFWKKMQAKLAIKSVHGDDARKYEPFWKVIDSHWNSLFCHPLYLAAYFLNPSYRYRQDFVPHSEVVRGLNECIVRLESDNMRRISASMQIAHYNSAQDDFGTELAISTRTGLEPAAWWQQHGISCLELQRIAVRILSQTCSSFACEHDWSIYDQIHCKRQNRISQKKLNDVIYVHYNLRLRECQLRKRSRDSKLSSVDSVLQAHLLDDWIIDANIQSSDVDKNILFGAELDDEYENDSIDYDGGGARSLKGSLELVTMADLAVGSPDVDHAMDAATDDESDLNYFDDDLSE
ncbi:hypothetical protein ACSQ67_020002 [Phaseolus vulgaris]